MRTGRTVFRLHMAALRTFSIAAVASWALSAPMLGVAQQAPETRPASACSADARSVTIARGGTAADPSVENGSTALPAHLYCPLDADDPRLRNDIADVWVTVRDQSDAGAAGARACVSASSGHITSCGPYAFSTGDHTGLAHLSPSKDVWLASGAGDVAYVIVQLPPPDGAAEAAGRSGLVGYRWYDNDD